jgi:hypothetical protein
MKLFIEVLPWFLSVLTIWMVVLQGDKSPRAWVVGCANQCGWLLWVMLTDTWGFLPMTVVLSALYVRNYFKWRRDERKKPAPVDSCATALRLAKDYEENPPVLLYPQCERCGSATHITKSCPHSESELQLVNFTNNPWVDLDGVRHHNVQAFGVTAWPTEHEHNYNRNCRRLPTVTLDEVLPPEIVQQMHDVRSALAVFNRTTPGPDFRSPEQKQFETDNP